MNFRISNSVIIFIALLPVVSCKEIIDINTVVAEPQIVVEAGIGTNETPVVYLTKTVDIDNLNEFPAVENAKITITDDKGRSVTLVESSPGQYIGATTALTGKVGNTYQLTIETGTKTITAGGTIPSQVKMDSVKILNSIYPGGGSPSDSTQKADFYEVKVKYSDPLNEENFYRFVVYLNGKVTSGNNVSDDKWNNGKQVERNLIIYNPEIKTGDVIGVEMQCIDKAVFEYFKSMGNSNGPRNASSPANPYTNLKGSLLGFFSAHTVERREFRIN